MMACNIRCRGFTLLELMITIGVMAVLATVAAPSFSELMASQRVKATASNLFVSILRARSEAIKSNSNVTISPLDGEWSKGWVMQNPLYANITLERHEQKGNVSVTGGPASLQYKSTGRLAGSAAPSFTISAADTDSKRCITISLSGQPVSKKGAC